MLKLGILKTGYIYPKKERSLRELLRRRMGLVQKQTSILLSMQSLIARYEGKLISANAIKTMTPECVNEYINESNIAFLFKQELEILKNIISQVNTIEKESMKQLRKIPGFKKIKEIPGIGNILGALIVLESVDIDRFKSAGNYCSYCRCVNSERKSNGKKKGENNRKNGNKYLSWAFIEAANFAVRHDKNIKKYYQRKMSRTNKIIATKTAAAKLSKACFFMLRDGIKFDMKIFNG